MRLSCGTIAAGLWLTAGLSFGEGRVYNFRGDPSGGYPNADPPLSFSTNENLTWKADIGQGCGAIVIVGERLFVQAAPNALVCLDKATGKDLWRFDNPVKGRRKADEQ
jgi:outer membrane protein assembly factor BamB